MDQDEAEKRAAGLGEPIRCLLCEYIPGWTTRVLAIDIGQDAIRVWGSAARSTYKIPSFDPNKSALIASAWRAQVTATPAAFTANSKRDKGRTQPVLILRVPGLQPLTIGCGEYIGSAWNWSASNLRFWWRGKVPWVKTPAYRVSAVDWLTLVENFGLAPYLEDKASPQPYLGGREWIASPQELTVASETGRDRPVARWVFMIVFAGLALFMFFLGAMKFYDYWVGTPTTATVTSCTTGKDSSCWGTWSIGGVSQSGTVPKAAVGSKLDVRAIDGKVFTATSWHGGAVLGGIFLAISIVVFVIDRSRTGTLVGKP